MREQEKRIAKRHQKSDGIIYTNDGRNHHFEAKGDVAKGIAVALSTALGFGVGFFLSRRY